MNPVPAPTLLNTWQVLVSLTFLKDPVAAAGTALLLGAAAMSYAQQDLAAATASFDSHAPAVVSPAAHPSTPAVVSPDQAEARTIEVVAKRFAFEPARIEVKEGERIKLIVKSDDGVHGIAIKKFKVSQKVPRGGEPVEIEFVATAVGEYPILCSEYCGKGHDDMKGTLVVSAR